MRVETYVNNSKHSVPRRLRSVLCCDGALREEGGGYLPGQSHTGSRLRSVRSPRGRTLCAATRQVAEEQQGLARDKLNSFLKSQFPVEECPRVLLSGDALDRSSHLVRASGFDLIIMPTHAGFFRRTLLGSTTAKVLNDADCPVLTTQHAETISPRQLEHREWVCAIGFSPDPERVLRYASQAARAVRANLTLVHVIRAPELRVQLDLEEHPQSAKREAASRRIEELQGAAGSHVPVRIAIAALKDMLTEEAGKLRADVLVMGRSPQSGALGRLRDLTYAVVRDAPCPVLSV